ncbi:MAG: permease of phosphate ABC transporter [Lawsonibacter sp.]
MIRTLLRRADRCAAQSTWRDLALLKFCLAALGVLIGLSIPVRQRRGATLLAGLVFLPTYLLLLLRYLPLLLQKEED